MKHIFKILLLSLLFFSYCSDENRDEENFNAIYLSPGPCCSNIELLDSTMVYSPLVGYEEFILNAINISEFNKDLQDGDSITIKYSFSADNNSCFIICNRHLGIPIELISLEKN